MSFLPDSIGSLFSPFLVDTFLEDDLRLLPRRSTQTKTDSPTIWYTVTIIFLSAFLFVAIISIYDVFRKIINNHYAYIALTDSNSHNTPDQISRNLIANENELKANAIFSLFTIIIGIIFWIIILNIKT